MDVDFLHVAVEEKALGQSWLGITCFEEVKVVVMSMVELSR